MSENKREQTEEVELVTADDNADSATVQSPIQAIRRNNKIFAVLIFLIGVILMIAPYVGQATLNSTYDFDSFKSAYCEQSAEKKVQNRSDINGIFTYGPYIDLKRGNYTGVIEYTTDVDRRYELTSEFGKKKLSEGTLKAGENSFEFSFVNDADVTNQSIELRTYYNGEGSYEFKAFKLKSGDIAVGAYMVVPAMLIVFAFLCLITKRISCLGAIYCAVVGVMTSGFLAQSPVYVAVAVVAQALWIVLMLAIEDFRKRLLSTNVEEAVVMLLSAFLLTSVAFLVKNKGGVTSVDLVGKISRYGYATMFVGMLHLVAVFRICAKKATIAYWMLLVSAVTFAFSIVIYNRNINFAIGVIAIIGYICYYLIKDDKLCMQVAIEDFKSYNQALIIVAVAAFGIALFYSYSTIMRYKAYGASCYDFGIFAQMYEYMARTGMPLTTCERGYLLSHFYIHFSPIYYVFLPIYCVFRRTETLFVIQAFMVYAAVVPLFLICKERRVKPLVALMVCFIYMFSPAIGQPVFFDFHENKFIPFFVLWFVYCFMAKKYKLSYIMLLLCLMIKEDTSIYMIILSLYFIVCEKRYKQGGIALGISSLYFVAVMCFISKYGLGLLEGHYGIYYLTGEKGLAALARNIIMNPGFFVKNVFAPENFEYIYYTIGSLLFVPLVVKDLRRLILLVPFVLFGLMTNYSYQHDIGYQYTYGLMVAMMLLFVINLSDLPVRWINVVCITCLCAGVILSYTYKGNGFTYYARQYKQNQSTYMQIDKIIDSIPDDVSVTSETYLLSHLTDKKELYPLGAELKDTDYYILQTNPNSTDYTNFISNYEQMGYELATKSGRIEVYKKTTAVGLK